MNSPPAHPPPSPAGASSAGSPVNVQTVLAELTRPHLDLETAGLFPIHGLLDGATWFRVRGLAKFWEQPDMLALASAMTDLIIGLHSMHRASLPVTPSLLLMITGGERNGIVVQLGLGNFPRNAGLEQVFADYFRGVLPGLELDENTTALNKPNVRVAPLLQGADLLGKGYFGSLGYLTGVPTSKTRTETTSAPHESTQLSSSQTQAPQTNGGEQIERLIRGMSGSKKWGYLVYAMPLSDHAVARELQRLIHLYTTLSVQLKQSETRTEQSQNRAVGAGGLQVVSSNRTFETTRRDVQLALDLVDQQIKRFETGRAEGMWQTQSFFFGEDGITATRAGALARACFGGAGSRPEPLRSSSQSKAGTLGQQNVQTLLSSSEVATLGALPQSEFMGYRVSEYVPFDVDVDAPAPDAILLGRVMEGATAATQWLSVQRDDLSKHALIVGVTGSGKTTTIFSLLQRLNSAAQPVPFLIIEPAKTEYRRLIGHASFKNLRVFTLGNEATAPFRLNPFEFDVLVDGQGAVHRTHVQTHIDYLKSVFNAAFVLYAPMPYILDVALHEVYQDKGWNLASGENARLQGMSPVNGVPAERLYPVFPTLTDLRHKVEGVVERLSYEDKIKGDVIAGLQARIDSLRLGGKGLMLDVPHGLEMQTLLGQPAVIELDRIGNDEEKAFLIGLLMTRICAVRRLQGNGPLRHITVIEEAHRLLKNVNTDVGTEEASNKAASVEVFSNALSEVRAYGEGVVIAEQIPAKLAPDAIKNTNLKLMHRLLAQDDRDAVGATMNLSEAQSRKAVALRPGEVIAFAEGHDKPLHLRMIAAGQVTAVPPSDAVLQQAMLAHLNPAHYQPVPEFDAWVNEADAKMLMVLRGEAVRLAQSPALRDGLVRYFYKLVAEPAEALSKIVWVLTPIRQMRSGSAGSREISLHVGAAVCAATALIQFMGDQQGWAYNKQDSIRHHFVSVVAQAVRGFGPALPTQAHQQLMATLQPGLVALSNEWKAVTTAAFGPLVGCAPCRAICLYRPVGQALIQDRSVLLDIQLACEVTTLKRDDYWRGIAEACDRAAGEIVQHPDAVRAVRTCIAAHFAAQDNPENPVAQRKFAAAISKTN